MSVDETRELVLRYWLSWQEGDGESMRACLADEILFDGLYATIHDPDRLVEFRLGGDPMRDVSMLESFFGADFAALLYAGRSATTGAHVRLGELIKLRRGRIVSIRSVAGSRPVVDDGD